MEADEYLQLRDRSPENESEVPTNRYFCANTPNLCYKSKNTYAQSVQSAVQTNAYLSCLQLLTLAQETPRPP